MAPRHLIWLSLVMVSAGCAARGPSPQVLTDAADRAKADSLLRDGCYSCLTDALAIYKRLKQPKGMFDAAILIWIRERELGFAPVRILGADVWDSGPAGDGKFIAAATDLISGELSGFDPVQRAALARRDWRPIEKDHSIRRALDPLFGTDVVATYVALTIDCESPKLIETVDIDGLTRQYEGFPLMQFRLSRCGRPAQAQHRDPAIKN